MSDNPEVVHLGVRKIFEGPFSKASVNNTIHAIDGEPYAGDLQRGNLVHVYQMPQDRRFVCFMPEDMSRIGNNQYTKF